MSSGRHPAAPRHCAARPPRERASPRARRKRKRAQAQARLHARQGRAQAQEAPGQAERARGRAEAQPAQVAQAAGAPRRKRKPQPSGTHPAPALPAAPAPAPGPAPVRPGASRARAGPAASPIAVYQGTFGPRQAERLLWRAGFGPRPGDVDRLAAMGLDAAVLSLTRPSGTAPMDGPEPTVDGAPLSPLDTWYGDHLYWFDRMVRSGHQLVERLALVFHDWWATTNDAVGSNELMLDQTNVFRAARPGLVPRA